MNKKISFILFPQGTIFNILKLVSFCQLYRQFTNSRPIKMAMKNLNIQRRNRLFRGGVAESLKATDKLPVSRG